MNKAARKREKIFSAYSQNLEWIKEHPKITITPEFKDSYVCPLCLEVFGRESRETTKRNYLTIEHNPPKSLGGTNEILTCKECNSKSGHKIDNHLYNRLLELDFLEGKPNSGVRARLNSDGFKVSSDLTITNDGTYQINVDRKNSNPSHVENFLANRSYTYKLNDPIIDRDFQNAGASWKMLFSMSPHFKSNERFAAIALLKIAYLISFQQFGYAFILNSHLHKVREQILNPEKDILPKVFWIKYDFPKEALGVNIINNPAELLCFLVVFNLVTPSQKQQFAIALPGLNKSGNKIYENLENILCQAGNSFTHINLEHLPTIDYIKDKCLAFDLINYWKSLVPKEE